VLKMPDMKLLFVTVAVELGLAYCFSAIQLKE
jgi:hypothetical protein